jgi:hypothetical protein
MQGLGIYGIGLAGGLGPNLAAAAERLGAGVLSKQERHGSLGVFASEFPVPNVPGGRRFGPWLKMSLAAAHEALAGSGKISPERLGVVGCTGYGSLAHTAMFLENLIRRGEQEPQPANFIYSVHNAAATQVALGVQARGFNLTLTPDLMGFELAWETAALRLAKKQEDRILILAADEWLPQLQQALKRFGVWRKGSRGAWLPGEGAAAVLFGPVQTGKPCLAGFGSERLKRPASAESLRARLTQALVEAESTWDDVVLVLAGRVPGDSETEKVFSPWENAARCKSWPYLQATGFYPAASVAALVLGVAALEGKASLPGFMQILEKNPHRKTVILYNHFQTGLHSWVIVKL